MRLTKPFNSSQSKIKCSCGAEILVVPNVKLMSAAIAAHLEEHKIKLNGREDAKTEIESIEDDLISKLLRKICET